MNNKNNLSSDITVLEIIRSYGRGFSTLDECYYKINEYLKENNKIDNIKSLDSILKEKLEKEFQRFCSSLKDKSNEEVISKAYEITVKEELKNEITNLSWHDREKAIMIDQNNLLDEFYHDWQNTDIALGDVLIDSLEDSVSMLTRYYGKQNKFMIKSKNKDTNYER